MGLTLFHFIFRSLTSIKLNAKSDKKCNSSLTSPWQFRPMGVFSGRKYKRNSVSSDCSFLSFQIFLISAKHDIDESDQGRTGTKSPIAKTNDLLLKRKKMFKHFFTKIFV